MSKPGQLSHESNGDDRRWWIRKRDDVRPYDTAGASIIGPGTNGDPVEVMPVQPAGPDTVELVRCVIADESQRLPFRPSDAWASRLAEQIVAAVGPVGRCVHPDLFCRENCPGRSVGRSCEVTDALRELVRLKDGPRDDAYRAEKDAAWDRARAVLRIPSSPGASALTSGDADGQARPYHPSPEPSNQPFRELLTEALDEYADHQSWRCGHPDRYPHDPDCPCGLVEFQARTRAALGATAPDGEG